MSVQEIETAVSVLPPSDLAEFMQWFEQFQAQTDEDRQWDKQIAQDMQVGRLDALIARAKEQADAEQCRPLKP